MKFKIITTLTFILGLALFSCTNNTIDGKANDDKINEDKANGDKATIDKASIDETRVINIYGFATGFTLDNIKEEVCMYKAIQVRKDSIFIDTCYAVYSEVLEEYEKNGDNMHLRFKKKKLEKHIAIKKDTEWLLSKVDLITSKKLHLMEKEINSYPCDSPFGLELELIENDSSEIIQLRDVRTCNGAFSRFIGELIADFNSKAN